MQLMSKNKTINNVIISLIILSTTVVGYLINTNENPVASFWPAAGFIAGLYLVFERKIIIGIITGLFIGHFIGYTLLVQETLGIATVFTFMRTVADVSFMLIFRRTMKFTKTVKMINFNSIVVYLLSIFISSFVFGAILSSVELLIDSNISFLNQLLRYGHGHFLSIGVFGSIIILSDMYDSEEKLFKVSIIYSTLYLIVFTVITFLIFYDLNNAFNFKNYKYVFVLLFVIPTLLFDYKMLMGTAIIFLSFGHRFYINELPIEEIPFTVSILHIFLISVLITVMLIRVMLMETRKKAYALESSNAQLEDLINSTFSLLRLGEQQHMIEEMNVSEYFKELFNVATSIFKNYDLASCYIRGEEFVHFIAAIGYDLDHLNNTKFRVEDFIWTNVVPEHIKESAKNVKRSFKTQVDYEKFIERNPELKESISFSFTLDKGIMGGFSFDIKVGSDRKFSSSDYDNLKSFQRILNSFYETKKLIAKNSNLKDEIVLSLIRTLELYDHYTGGHSEEVAYFSELIAKKLGYDDQFVSDVFWAGIVHDIGKVGISSDILNKPEKLSLEEYNKIKAHPGFGYEILKRSEDLKGIAVQVKHHHEWWNGAGYPDSLKGEEIPVGSRIICVADAVSSMATKRPYNETKTTDEIVTELTLYKGSQFEPKACDAMIEIIREGIIDEYYQNRLK